MPKELRNSLQVDVYAVLSRAVEEGVAHGWRRAHKHVEPGQRADEGMARETIRNEVLTAVAEYFRFGDEE